MTLAILFNHTPWVAERVDALRKMMIEVSPLARGIPYWVHGIDYRGQPWQHGGKLAWMLTQWRWARVQSATHVMFCTDDLHLAPGFVDIVTALLEAVPSHPIALLSNHPKAPELAADGHRFYATNSWLTGPGYILPMAMLRAFVAWFEALPSSEKLGPESWNEDAAINEWVTRHGPGRTIHTLPGLIEHRADLKSTVGHGDRFSRERVSWSATRTVIDVAPDGFEWRSAPLIRDLAELRSVSWWNEKGGAQAAPLLLLPSQEEGG